MNSHKVALTLGFMFGGMHLLWSVLVILGLGQPLIDFILWAHMVHFPYIVGPFDASAAFVLVVVTAIIGYVVGYMFATVWNKFHR